MPSDTIFAVSSGAPPAAIGIVRVSGVCAGAAVETLAGGLPKARQASLRTLRDSTGDVLDRALVLWFPGPATATGEDLAEFHCHGGRAVLAAVERVLSELEGLRMAEPGEFTRRAFANGRIDLAEAEALADLVSAETELQRRSAQAALGGAISGQVEQWRVEILRLGAQVEASLDFSDEDDVEDLPPAFYEDVARLRSEMDDWLARPGAERLRDGIRVVLAGPPNSGKSTLFNTLIRDSAAITSPEAGTTRDVIERPVAFGGVPFLLVDTAGLHEAGSDAIEVIGMDRAREQLERADIVLWLGREKEGPAGALEIQPRADEANAPVKQAPRHIVSAVTGAGVAALEADLIERARQLLPKPGAAALGAQQRSRVGEAASALQAIVAGTDLLIIGENLRQARVAFDRLLGRTSTEDMLDALFGRFCIGK
ncbi:tRNA uridine(34) 5-carboxymethylaminomethyl synthesis GTPase MnmE [Erythrobacter sp. QSSC1-22B]|uniref:tRNA uridine-5-carboxymethylaminomethyl(34) synthesis GTPase MnmE n=1 Tax=Erythrobacter sp. QSSC1-22B TaxID=1860125 RepID=UPI000804A6A5|nr:tRNA uridine-5-carboxymethylaminomethyl(34) synthesis GTPase MnmE [Erythrobacter sp. QSSC1-22B]OBX19993.1 tRNA uridine(34) 5-carboxymethylaminomethyl synthesis GTPase MnmE [Erythrobacter sp. QSSC1-22B]